MVAELTSQRRHLHLGAPFSPDWELRGRLFHVQRAPVFFSCETQGRHLHLVAPFSSGRELEGGF